jgi:hypothetical protein
MMRNAHKFYIDGRWVDPEALNTLDGHRKLNETWNLMCDDGP